MGYRSAIFLHVCAIFSCPCPQLLPTNLQN
uniref:Uncharacterized protein n=1 Tax=Arundo donax TaxID=35708 RepID=A0A0A9F170_ARUDO